MQDCWVRTRATLPARDVELQHGSSVERHLLKHIDTWSPCSSKNVPSVVEYLKPKLTAWTCHLVLRQTMLFGEAITTRFQNSKVLCCVWGVPFHQKPDGEAEPSYSNRFSTKKQSLTASQRKRSPSSVPTPAHTVKGASNEATRFSFPFCSFQDLYLWGYLSKMPKRSDSFWLAIQKCHLKLASGFMGV